MPHLLLRSAVVVAKFCAHYEGRFYRVPMFRCSGAFWVPGFCAVGQANAGNSRLCNPPLFLSVLVFVCFCFSFKLNANKFAFLLFFVFFLESHTPLATFTPNIPTAIALSAELWGKKCHLLWALVPSIWFTFISLRLVFFFGLGRKVFQFPNPHKMTKFNSRK